MKRVPAVLRAVVVVVVVQVVEDKINAGGLFSLEVGCYLTLHYTPLQQSMNAYRYRVD